MTKSLTNPETAFKMSLREKVGQFFQPAAFINDSEEEIQKLEELIRKHNIGSLCFFHSRASAATNFEGKKKIIHNEASLNRLHYLINRYKKAASYPLLISIDAEWGLAMRIENTPQLPYAVTLGAIKDDDLVEETGQIIGAHCLSNGIHWNLAPVVDINSNPHNPVIGYRSFGNDVHLVTKKANAFLSGAKNSGVLNCIKHFPGHGDTATDSHLGLPEISKPKDALWQEELRPYQELIKEGVDAVMIGHLSVPALDDSGTPATLSSPIIKETLINKLGFDGVIISDALNMHAVSKRFDRPGDLEHAAFEAGNDILCFAEDIEAGINQILEKTTAKEINERFLKVWKLKCKAQLALTQNHNFDKRQIQSLNLKIAKQSLTEVKWNTENTFKSTKGDFKAISIGKPSDNIFFNSVSQKVKLTLPPLTDLRKGSEHPLLIALFLPKVKPADHFGLGSKVWNDLLEVLKNNLCTVYLFGNPYLLNQLQLNTVDRLVLAYQDFDEFQHVAAAHFLGQHKAIGQLPITLTTTHEAL